MNPSDIASAITSGLLGPAVGALLVLAAWLFSKVRDGVPWRDQLRHAWTVLRPVLPWAVGAGGLVLLAGGSYLGAASVAIGALLTAAGFKAPTPPRQLPPEEPTP